MNLTPKSNMCLAGLDLEPLGKPTEKQWIMSNSLPHPPHIGVQHEGATYKGCEVRKIIIRQVTVFYSPQSDKVTILAVWNNYQDPDNIPYRLSELE